MMIKQKIKWGLLLGLSISLGTQILTWLGLGLTNLFVLLTYLLVAVFIFHALRKQRRSQQSISLWEALITVLVLVIISRYVFQFFLFLYVNYFHPGWIAEVSKYWSELLAEKGTSQVLIDAQIKAFQDAYRPFNMFTIEIIRYGFAQIVLGLLIALFFVFKKNKQTTPQSH